MAVDTTARLARLRELMNERQLDAYIVPAEDAHSSEYVAECDKRRQFISGFSGSSGFALVTQNEALLWTDGRYWLQAQQELDSNWTLMKQGLASVKTRDEWLASKFAGAPVSNIGVDARLLPISAAKAIEQTLKLGNHKLDAKLENLVDLVWTSRPAVPINKVMALSNEYTGKTITAKIAQVREDLRTKNAVGFLVTGLDDVAWLFNLRGSDIDYNPVFFSYAFVGLDTVKLYLSGNKYDDTLRDHLGDDVQLRPYEAVFDDMAALSAAAAETSPKPKILVDRSCNLALQQALYGVQVEDMISPITTLKALKNECELEGMRNAHRRDGVALCRFFAWLEGEITNGHTVNEIEAATKAYEYRSQQKDFVSLSFPTIAASGPHGAIIHYRPSEASCAPITSEQLFLCDSGAQYLDGTTDVTRTIHLGNPTQQEKECFTYVLKAHIALARCKFPNNISGYQLDIAARLPMWQQGMDYRHGTGHGVGAFLNVHEGPHGIGTRIALNEVALKSNMTVTNEPGYYLDGKFGIRIENVMIIRNVTLANNFSEVGYLGFEAITLVPIQTKLVIVSLLTDDEREWLNDYHRTCREQLGPLLEGDTSTQKWLFTATEPI